MILRPNYFSFNSCLCYYIVNINRENTCPIYYTCYNKLALKLFTMAPRVTAYRDTLKSQECRRIRSRDPQSQNLRLIKINQKEIFSFRSMLRSRIWLSYVNITHDCFLKSNIVWDYATLREITFSITLITRKRSNHQVRKNLTFQYNGHAQKRLLFYTTRLGWKKWKKKSQREKECVTKRDSPAWCCFEDVQHKKL